MSTLGWIVLAFVVGFLWGEGAGEKATYNLVIKECERLGGFFYGHKIVKCSEVIDNSPPPPGFPPPARPAPPMPHIPQPKPETRG
jgi:hypothetical protein